MTGRMPWGRHEADTVTDFRRSFHRFRQASVKHGLDRVRERAALHLHKSVWGVFVNRAVQGDVLLVHEI